MSDYIRIDNTWVAIYNIYKNINNTWALQNASSTNILSSSNNLFFYNSAQIDIPSLIISGVSEYTGKTFNLQGIYNGRVSPVTWTITSGSQYATINTNGKVTINSGTQNKTITVQASYQGLTETKTITISYDNQLTIESADTITGTSGNVIARYNGDIVTPTWSITSGNSYATIDSTGTITITASGTITVSATYSGYTVTKTIELVYDAGSTTETTVDENGNVTTETTTTVENQDGSTTTTTTTTTTNDDGSSSSTETSTTENEDGSSTTTSTTTSSDGSSSETTSTTSAPDENGSVTTETSTTTNNSDGTSSETNSTVTENEDGSSESQTTTINYDENGDTTGSTENTTTNNSDGSSSSSTTNYNSSGDPTDQQNVNTDSDGNEHTQDVEFDSNGDPTVTGYVIDTSGNESGNGDTISGSGVNTEFVPFNYANDGFIMHVRFQTTAAEQPRPPIVADTEDNSTNYLYTILGAKTAYKINNAWPGFEIRWVIAKSGNGTSGTLQFNTTLQGESSTSRITLTGSNNIYDVTVTYDPQRKLGTYIFNAWNNITNKSIRQVNKKIHDGLDLDFIIGYAIDGNGNQIRHSSVTIYEFSISKITV